MQKNSIIVIVAVVAVLAFVAGGWFFTSFSFPASSGKEEDSEAVATVNGEEVLRADFEALRGQLAANQGLDTATLDEGTLAQLDEQAVNILVSEVLLRQAAEESGVEVSEADVNAQVEVIKNRFESETEFQQTLAAEGMTEEEFVSQLRDELILQAYLEQELNLEGVAATESEVSSTYNELTASAADAPALEDIYGQVEGLVLQQKQQGLVNQLVEELRAEADIEILI